VTQRLVVISNGMAGTAQGGATDTPAAKLPHREDLRRQRILPLRFS
jgi:hypothetical protein